MNIKKLGKTKEKYSVGLDIGTQFIKIAKLSFNKEQAEIHAFDVRAAGANTGEELKKIKQSLGLDSVNIGVAGPQTVVRQITFPKMSADELKHALRFEAPKHIPFPLSDINLDAIILKEDLPENKMLVLIAAAKKELVSQRLNLIEDAGMKASLVCIDSISLINAFNFNYGPDPSLKQKGYALLNIGATITNLAILEDSIPRLSRDINIAGDSFTHRVMDSLGLDFKAAQECILNPKKENSQQLLIAQESVMTSLASEIRTSFDYFESQGSASVNKIFLSGGGSNTLGLKDMLANALGIEVQYWDPLKQISVSAGLDPGDLKPFANQMAVAIGLALRQ